MMIKLLSTTTILLLAIASTEAGAADCTTLATYVTAPTRALATDDFINFSNETLKNATENLGNTFIVPVETTAYSLYAEVLNAPGAGDNWIITMSDDESNTSLTCTISGTGKTCQDLTNTPTVEAGSRITLRVSSAGSAGVPANPAGMLLSFCLGTKA